MTWGRIAHEAGSQGCNGCVVLCELGSQQVHVMLMRLLAMGGLGEAALPDGITLRQLRKCLLFGLQSFAQLLDGVVLVLQCCLPAPLCLVRVQLQR